MWRTLRVVAGMIGSVAGHIIACGDTMGVLGTAGFSTLLRFGALLFSESGVRQRGCIRAAPCCARLHEALPHATGVPVTLAPRARVRVLLAVRHTHARSSACYSMLKEERRINNDYHLKGARNACMCAAGGHLTSRTVHGSPSEWGKLVSKRILERHPLYSPSKGTWARPLRVDACIPDPPVDKRARREDTAMAVELDHVEELIRNEVLEALLGRQQLCSCGKLIEMGEMFR